MSKKKRAFRNPNGYGSVVKLGGKRRKPFASRVTTEWQDGKQVYKYIGYYEKREDAMAALADYNRGLLTLETNSVTFQDLAERWFDTATKEMKEGSIRVYTTSYKSCKELYKHRIVDINADAIQRMLDNNGKKKSTNIQIRSFIKQIFDYAIANKIVTFSPVTYVKARGGEKREGKRFYDEHIEWLWKHQDLPHVETFLILLYTGMRIQELLTLPISAINLEEQYLIWGMKTPSGEDRMIPIAEKILPIIERKMKESKNLLIKYDGRKASYQTTLTIFKKTLELMGADEDYVIHDFRRTTASLLSDAEVPLTTIQKILGHKSVDVTSQVYIKKSINSLIAAIDKI